MKLAISIGVLLASAIIVLFFVVIIVVDMAGRVEYIQNHLPWLRKWVQRKQTHGVLLLIAVLLLAVNLDDLSGIVESVPKIPQIVFSPPAAPRFEQGLEHKAKGMAAWQQSATPQSGPFGPILAVELSQEFSKLNPCLIKLRWASDKVQFRATLV